MSSSSSSSSLYAFCCFWPLLAFVFGADVVDPIAFRKLADGIPDLIESSVRYYLRSDVDATVDVNLMLGVSIMKGQFKSCSGNDYDGFDRTDRLTAMIDALYSKFYENNSTDIEQQRTTKSILDCELWTSPERIAHVTPRPSAGPDDARSPTVDGDDPHFRVVSDECLRRAIVTGRLTAECVGPEPLGTARFSGYALTHQVLYLHVYRRTNRDDPVFGKIAEKIIRDKCGKIHDEAVRIADDPQALETYRDLFLEQIAVCGMENVAELVKPEWLSIVTSKKHFDCFQYPNNPYCRDSHLTGVSLAALGVYWKFLCYTMKNTVRDVDFQNTIIQL